MTSLETYWRTNNTSNNINQRWTRSCTIAANTLIAMKLVHSFSFLFFLSFRGKIDLGCRSPRRRTCTCVRGLVVLIAVRVGGKGKLCGFIREIFGFFWAGKDVSSPFEQLKSVMCCGSPIFRLRLIRCLSDSPYAPSSFISATSPAVPRLRSFWQ